jgi:hypothetical protein
MKEFESVSFSGMVRGILYTHLNISLKVLRTDTNIMDAHVQTQSTT